MQQAVTHKHAKLRVMYNKHQHGNEQKLSVSKAKARRYNSADQNCYQLMQGNEATKLDHARSKLEQGSHGRIMRVVPYCW
jgi:hypothetical protein